MNFLESLFLAIAVLAPTAVATVGGVVPGSHRLRGTFFAGTLLFAGQGLVSFRIAIAFSGAGDLVWSATLFLGLATALAWSLFLTAMTMPERILTASRWRLACALATALALGNSLAVVFVDPFVPDRGQPYMPVLSAAGLAFVAAELLFVTAILVSLELSFRSASPDTRWRVKYLLIGLSVIFGTRLYVLTHAILVNRLEASDLAAHAASFPVGGALILVSLLRGGLADTRLHVSRALLGKSVTSITVGAYLLAAGASGWLLSSFQAPQFIFWAVLGLLLCTVLASVLFLSEDLRWRVRRTVARHLYSQKYDYRDEWLLFTQRLGAPTTSLEFSERFLWSVSTTFGPSCSALYLSRDTGDGLYQLAASLGSSHWPNVVELRRPPLDSLIRPPWHIRLLLKQSFEPVAHDRGAGLDMPVWPLLAVPLIWQGSPAGFLLLGSQRNGVPYDAEDLVLLRLLAQQAVSALVGLRLAEASARSREFQALHRLTSFIMHDLKSSLSTLELLTRNAESRLSDLAFQRDALRTLTRTVDRMRRLLARLSPTVLSGAEVRTHVDLRAVLQQVAKDVPQEDGLEVVQILEPVPEILGDPESLERVVRGLVDNALDAMERKGTLTLCTAWRPPWVECTVSDTGCGMTPKFIEESLFRPFRSTKKDGWGLGLYHAQEVVDSHHGRIEVLSEPGKGTAMTLRFPPASSSPKPTA